MVREGKRFGVAQRVFVRGSDDVFYVGFVIKVSEQTKECYVTLENDTKTWYPFSKIRGNQGVTDRAQDEIVCCLCTGAGSLTPNQIVLCDDCGLGYHQCCHNPQIENTVLEPDAPWSCRLCDHLQSHSRKSRKKSMDGRPVKHDKFNGFTSKKLPTKTLTRGRCEPKLNGVFPSPQENNILEKKRSRAPSQSQPTEKLDGEMKTCQRCDKDECWFIRMMKCKRCKSWFHGGCVRNLKWKLLCGDRFYIFVCGDCNGGQEYIKRLPITWSNVAHLAIFNLMLSSFKKYFDLPLEILPWINKSFDLLHLTASMRSEGGDVRCRESLLLTAMQDNKSLFKNAKEIKKRGSMWSLRERLTPPAPRVSIPSKVAVTDKVVEALSIAYHTDTVKIQKQWCSHKRPASESNINIWKPKAKRRRISTPANSAHHQPPSSPPHPLHPPTTKNRRKPKQKVNLETSIPPPAAFEGPHHPFKTAVESRMETEYIQWQMDVLTRHTQQSTSQSAESAHLTKSESPDHTGEVAQKHWESVNNEIPHRRKIQVKRLRRGRPTMAEAAHVSALTDMMESSVAENKRCLRSDVLSTPPGPNTLSTAAINSGYDDFNAVDASPKGDFQVLGRRIGAKGKPEYLIQWNRIGRN